MSDESRPRGVTTTIHQAHSTSDGAEYGYLCNCGDQGRGFPTRDAARAAGDRHLDEANAIKERP